MSSKRIIIATLSGLLCGFVCYGFAAGGAEPLPWPIATQIILSRTLLGFAIGISCCQMGHWSIHGLVMGFLFSLPLGFSSLMAPENPQFTPMMMAVSTVIMGMIYGLSIEVITTLLFKARMTRLV